MTASLRALGVLLAIAVAMVAIVVADPWRAEAIGADERAIVPGWSPETARTIGWRGGETIRRGPAGWTAASGAPLDRANLDAVIAALRGGRWQRRGDGAAAAGQVVATLDIDGTALAIGQPLAGTEQTWIVRGDRAYLVDNWIVRALAIAPWQLREHRPLAAAIDAPADAVSFAIGAAPAIAIDVRRARREGTWIAPGAVEALVTAARAIVLVGPAGDAEPALAAPPQLTVTAGAAKLVVYGPCKVNDGSILVGGAITGCIDAAQSNALFDAATALAKPLDDLRDLRPLPASPAAAPTAFLLGASGRIWLGKQAGISLDTECEVPSPATCAPPRLDPRAVTELVAALSTPGQLAPPPAREPPGALEITIELDGGGEPIVLTLVTPDLVQRDSTTLRVDPAAFAVLARPITAYLDRTLWAEDPLTISAITVAGAHRYVRGDVLGEWSRDGAPAKPDARLEAYAALLATPHALGAAVTAPAAPRPIAITIATPANQTVTHELAVGRSGAACVAITYEAGMVSLPVAVCDGP